MIGFLAFIIVLAGCIDWLLIGLLQYDFVAGLFGYQASIFSRLIYILVGISALVLLFKAFKDKGKINIIDFKFLRKKKEKEEAQMKAMPANIEASREELPRKEVKEEPRKQLSGADFSEQDEISYKSEETKRTKNSIFDEEFNK